MKSSATPDLLCPPDYAVRKLGAKGLLAALDHSKLPNTDKLEKRFQLERPHDTESRVSIQGLGNDGLHVSHRYMIYDQPTSWEDFWVGEVSGRVTVLNSPGEVIGSALKMRRYSYNASSKRD